MEHRPLKMRRERREFVVQSLRLQGENPSKAGSRCDRWEVT